MRAGLELIAAVTGLKTRASLQTRVGIATGLVVVGDLIGSGEAQERGIVGETPNLAARLQSIAEPNSVVIAEGTRKQLGNLFELRDLGARDLKGLAGPARAWAVLWRSSIESRFEALRSGGTPLVGRAEEFELLLRRWQQVESGEGRVVVLTGEPGIGKSRITAALQGHLQLDPHARLRQFCSPHHQSTPLHPWIGQIERAAGLTRDDTAEEKLTKLEAVLAQSNAPPEEIGFIAALLSIPNAARYPLPELSPQKRKEKTLTALLAHMERLAARQPVLAVYEDVHWIDPTTLELLTLTIKRVQHLPVLLLVTARPEFRSPWPGYAHRGPRSPLAHLRLVHRRLRHAGLEGGQGLARRFGAMRELKLCQASINRKNWVLRVPATTFVITHSPSRFNRRDGHKRRRSLRTADTFANGRGKEPMDHHTLIVATGLEQKGL